MLLKTTLNARRKVVHTDTCNVCLRHNVTMETFGKRIARLREEKGLVQVEAAVALGISRGHLAKMEKDKSIPSYEVLCLLADFFEVTLDYLRHGGVISGSKTVSCILKDKSEIHLIRAWRGMDVEEQRMLALFISKLAPEQIPSQESA